MLGTAQHVKTLVHATVHPCLRPAYLRLPLSLANWKTMELFKSFLHCFPDRRNRHLQLAIFISPILYSITLYEVSYHTRQIISNPGPEARGPAIKVCYFHLF